MKRVIGWMSILVAFAVVLVACGGEAAPVESASPQESTIEVVTYDMYFGEDPNNMDNPPTWTVAAGSVVTVNFDNRGGLEHNWAVVKQGEEVPVPFEEGVHDDLILYSTGVVAAGDSTSVPFRVPDEPGEYVVICTVAGHYPAMQGRLIIN